MPNAVQTHDNGTVYAQSRLARRFEHPALTWISDSAPDLMGTVHDPEAGTFTDPDTGEVVHQEPGQ